MWNRDAWLSSCSGVCLLRMITVVMFLVVKFGVVFAGERYRALERGSVMK